MLLCALALSHFLRTSGNLPVPSPNLFNSLQVLEQASSAAAEGDENMREQLLRMSKFLPEDGVE